jgi:chitin synthase
MGLVSIIVLLCLFLGFITFGLQTVACMFSKGDSNRFNPRNPRGDVARIRGDVFNITVWDHPGQVGLRQFGDQDVSWLFQFSEPPAACRNQKNIRNANFPCTVDGSTVQQGFCHTPSMYDRMVSTRVGTYKYDFDDVRKSKQNLIIFDGLVLNVDRYLQAGKQFIDDPVFNQLLQDSIGTDASYAFRRDVRLHQQMNCLKEYFKVGYLQFDTTGCLLTNVRKFFQVFCGSFDYFLFFQDFHHAVVGCHFGGDHYPVRDCCGVQLVYRRWSWKATYERADCCAGRKYCTSRDRSCSGYCFVHAHAHANR